MADLNKILTEAAEQVVGRGDQRVGIPYLAGHAAEVLEMRQTLKEQHEKMKKARTTEEEIEEKKEYIAMSRRHRKARQKWRAEWVEDLVEELNKAWEIHDTGRFYKALRELGVELSDFSQKGRSSHTPAQLRTHFAKLGETENVVQQAVIDRLPPPRPICERLAETPDKEEIISQMKKMKQSIGGKCETNIQMIRQGGKQVQECVAGIVQKMWETDPEEWEDLAHEVVVIPLWKRKGDKLNLDNYRGIALICIYARIIARVVAARLRDYAEEEGLLPNHQFGFRPLRSCTGALMVVRRLIDMASRVDPALVADKLVVEPLDIKKAYPNSSRNASDAVQTNMGIPEKLRNLEKGLMSCATYVVRSAGGDSEPFQLKRGFKEGCPSSCVQYNLYHTAPINEYEELCEEIGGGVAVTVSNSTDVYPPGGITGKKLIRESATWPTVWINMISFADDTNMIHRESKADERRAALTQTLADWGETVHPDKWQHMRCSKRDEGREGMEDFWQRSIEMLGSWLTEDGSVEKEIAERIAKARKLWGLVYRRLPKLGLTTKQKGSVVQACIISSLLYGCEVIGHSSKHLDVMQRFVGRIIRAITMSSSLTIRDMKGHITQTDLRLRTGIDTVRVMIINRTLGFLGHVARRGRSRLEWQALFAWLDSESEFPAETGNRLSWSKQVNAWLKRIEVLHAEQEGRRRWWHEIAEERNTKGVHTKWNKLRHAVVQEFREKDDNDTHENRHANDEDEAGEEEKTRTALEEEAEAKLRRKQTRLLIPKVTCECGTTMQKDTLKNHKKLSCPLRRKSGEQPRARPDPKAKAKARGAVRYEAPPLPSAANPPAADSGTVALPQPALLRPIAVHARKKPRNMGREVG